MIGRTYPLQSASFRTSQSASLPVPVSAAQTGIDIGEMMNLMLPVMIVTMMMKMMSGMMNEGKPAKAS